MSDDSIKTVVLLRKLVESSETNARSGQVGCCTRFQDARFLRHRPTICQAPRATTRGSEERRLSGGRQSRQRAWAIRMAMTTKGAMM